MQHTQAERISKISVQKCNILIWSYQCKSKDIIKVDIDNLINAVHNIVWNEMWDKPLLYSFLLVYLQYWNGVLRLLRAWGLEAL